MPLILRYVLQTCVNTAQAVQALKRIPTHMSYNVTVVDAKRLFSTVYLSPDRAARVTHAAVATNHQERVEWFSHARLTATVERERYLLKRLTLHLEPAERFVAAFLKLPLYSTAFDIRFGTLYTALYRPWDLQMELRWPGTAWTLPIDGPLGGARRIAYPQVAALGADADADVSINGYAPSQAQGQCRRRWRSRQRVADLRLREPVCVRNGYARIDADAGEPISTVLITNTAIASTGDGLVFDHVAFIAAINVPEPTTFVLLGLGLAGIGFSRRRRRHRAAWIWSFWRFSHARQLRIRPVGKAEHNKLGRAPDFAG